MPAVFFKSLNAFSKFIDSLQTVIAQTVKWLVLAMSITVCIIIVARFFDIGSTALQESVTYMHGLNRCRHLPVSCSVCTHSVIFVSSSHSLACNSKILRESSTGIVGATVVTMGLMSLPTMIKRGYSPELACGTICATGTLGQIIPPSIALVLLGDIISSAYQQSQLNLGI